ncbi:MAG TPA: DNA internalization-related competence protein ComEC/Rec2 [Thermoanaerobaculia bacterium]|nr:DNA internalization-related competence protein ComEC/Rec2 [Thermoanaerobaculia bacterium]
MPDERRPPLPAALPLLSFVAGLVLEPRLIDAPAAAFGLLLICPLSVLLLVLRRPSASFWSSGAAVTVLVPLFLALGLLAGGRGEISRVREAEHLQEIPPDRFSRIEAEIDRRWNCKDAGCRLRVASFDLIRHGRRIRFASPLTLYAPTGARPLDTDTHLTAEGFFRISRHGTYYLSVKSHRLIETNGTTPGWSPRGWNRILAARLQWIAEVEPEHADTIALIQALALGRIESLPDEIRESYRRGGTYHLLVFSGMQIAFAAALLGLAFRWIGNPRVGDAALLLLSVLAPLFAGSDSSVTRASLVIGLFAFSRMVGRPTSPENLYLVSALLRLLTVPEDLHDPGFALTYAAAGGLIFIGKPLARHSRHFLTRILLFGVGAEIATTPLTLFYFHHYVLGSSIVTALMGPLLSLMLGLCVLICGVAMFEPFLAEPLLDLLALLERVVEFANDCAGNELHLSGMAAAPPPWLVSLCFTASFIMVTFLRARRGALVSAIAILVIPSLTSLAAPLRSGPSTPTVEILDVGQGDAILIRHGERAILVDGGGSTGGDAFGRAVLIPMLLDRGVRRLDAVALSHPHADHAGGLAALVETLRVDELWISRRQVADPLAQALLESSRKRMVMIRTIEDEGPLRRGVLRFDALVSRLRHKRATMNNGSVVYRVTLGKVSVLLAGDIEKEAEQTLTEEKPEWLRAQVLKVPHHGARDSATGPFLDAVDPRVALISCGKRNSFGHPHAATLERLVRRRIPVWRTDRHGSLRLELEGRVIRVTPSR